MTQIPRPPIRHVWESFGGTVTGRPIGGWAKAVCVLHDDHTPSAQINEDEDKYHCFVCNVSGDAIDLIMRVENVEFIEALNRASQLLADSGGEVRELDNASTSLLPGRKGHRQGRRNWVPTWKL